MRRPLRSQVDRETCRPFLQTHQAIRDLLTHRTFRLCSAAAYAIHQLPSDYTFTCRTAPTNSTVATSRAIRNGNSKPAIYSPLLTSSRILFPDTSDAWIRLPVTFNDGETH